VTFVAFIECRLVEKQMQMVEVPVDEIFSMFLHLVKQLGISAGWAAQNAGSGLGCVSHSFNTETV
jgi:hypothetical protein